MLSQAQVEEEIMRISALAERVTFEIAKRAQEAAERDAHYKVNHAKAFLRANGTVGERDAHAAVATADDYRARKIAEAMLLSAQEAGRNYRTQLDALRSICANLRALVVG